MCIVLLEMTRECVMTFGAVLQDKCVIPSHLTALYVLLGENITRKLSSLSLDLFFKILLLRVIFPMFFSIASFSAYFI